MKHYIKIVAIHLIALSCTVKAMETPPADVVTFQNDPRYKELEATAMKLPSAINKKPVDWQTLLVDWGQFIASNKTALEQYSRKGPKKVLLLFAGKPELLKRLQTAMQYFGANTISVYVDAAEMIGRRVGPVAPSTSEVANLKAEVSTLKKELAAAKSRAPAEPEPTNLTQAIAQAVKAAGAVNSAYKAFTGSTTDKNEAKDGLGNISNALIAPPL